MFSARSPKPESTFCATIHPYLPNTLKITHQSHACLGSSDSLIRSWPTQHAADGAHPWLVTRTVLGGAGSRVDRGLTERQRVII